LTCPASISAPIATSSSARFANPALKHRTWQIAMDGSQKLPQRLLGTIRDRLAAGGSIDRLALGVAAGCATSPASTKRVARSRSRTLWRGVLRSIADAAVNHPAKLVSGLLGVEKSLAMICRETHSSGSS